jgi:hypothetical protein
MALELMKKLLQQYECALDRFHLRLAGETAAARKILYSKIRRRKHIKQAQQL